MLESDGAAPCDSATYPDWRRLDVRSCAGTVPGLKLPEEAEIVLEEKPQIIDPIFEHGDPFDSHAEGKTGHFLGIVADHPENLRINHT